MSEVTVRPATRADAAALIAGNISSRDHHAPWSYPFTDREGFEAWIAASAAGKNCGLVARLGPVGPLVGVITLSQILRGNFLNAYLGYYGMAETARQGLMTQAVLLAAEHAFGALGLHRLEANVQPGNQASLALLRRVGFRREGFSPQYLRIGGAWRDHERWALLATDPRAPYPANLAG